MFYKILLGSLIREYLKAQIKMDSKDEIENSLDPR